MAHRRAAAAAAASDTEPLLPPEAGGRPAVHRMGGSDGGSAGQPAGSSSVRNQVLASVCATFGGLAAGLTLGYSSPAGPDLQEDPAMKFDDSEISLIGSMMPLGALFGGLACGPTMDRFGRRTTMVFINLPAMLGWLLITYANGFGMVLAGRIFTGFAAGCTTVVCPTYVGEVCEARVRGTMGASFQFQVTLGILLTYIIGKYANWNFLAMTCAFFPAVWLILVCFMRESPVWLLEHDRETEALDVLTWLRGPQADVNSELNGMLQKVREAREQQASFRDLGKRENLRPFVLSLMLMLLQQLSGINAVIFYTTDIFKDAGSSIEADLSTIIVGIVQMLSTFAGVVLVDRLGRKVLLIASDAIMGVCLMALGVYFYMKDQDNADNLGWLPLVSLMLFIFAFSIGFGPIPWLMMGELFAPEVKGVASGVATAFNWTLAFIVTLTFAPLVDGMTEAGVFWLFAVICFAGVAYVTVFCYETKGKSLQEIQDHFRN